MFKRMKKRFVAFMVTCSALVAGMMSASADTTTPTSMLGDGVKGIINDFAADIVPTVIELIGILVPVGLALWAIGFAVKKGIGFLQKKAKKAV